MFVNILLVHILCIFNFMEVKCMLLASKVYLIVIYNYSYYILFLFLYTGGMLFLMAVSTFNFICKQFNLILPLLYRVFFNLFYNEKLLISNFKTMINLIAYNSPLLFLRGI